MPEAIRNVATIARFRKELETHPFELIDTIVTLISTNPWKATNKILVIVVHVLFFVVW